MKSTVGNADGTGKRDGERLRDQAKLPRTAPATSQMNNHRSVSCRIFWAVSIPWQHLWHQLVAWQMPVTVWRRWWKKIMSRTSHDLQCFNHPTLVQDFHLQPNHTRIFLWKIDKTIAGIVKASYLWVENFCDLIGECLDFLGSLRASDSRIYKWWFLGI